MWVSSLTDHPWNVFKEPGNFEENNFIIQFKFSFGQPNAHANFQMELRHKSVKNWNFRRYSVRKILSTHQVFGRTSRKFVSLTQQFLERRIVLMAILFAVFSMAQLMIKSIAWLNYVFSFCPNFKCLLLHHLRNILIKSKFLLW